MRLTRMCREENLCHLRIVWLLCQWKTCQYERTANAQSHSLTNLLQRTLVHSCDGRSGDQTPPTLVKTQNEASVPGFPSLSFLCALGCQLKSIATTVTELKGTFENLYVMLISLCRSWQYNFCQLIFWVAEGEMKILGGSIPLTSILVSTGQLACCHGECQVSSLCFHCRSGGRRCYPMTEGWWFNSCSIPVCCVLGQDTEP